jgi:hypothetical protein
MSPIIEKMLIKTEPTINVLQREEGGERWKQNLLTAAPMPGHCSGKD